MRDFLRQAGISGDLLGTNGVGLRSLWWGIGVIAVLVAAINAVNVTTLMHDRPDLGVAQPVVWEGSSWFTLVLFAFIPWVALQAAPLESRPRWRVVAVHLSAMLLFSLGHVGGFVLIRQAVYAALGHHYGSGPLTRDFFYEFRKDAVSYVFAVAIFRMLARQIDRAAFTMSGEEMFSIRDGARLTRFRLADVLAVTSAGNYVEFVLADGRRPLMRRALSALEKDLAPRGFVRTHRSWVVNAKAVTGLKPEGSGDYTVELGHITVPLSRRFPEALATLRSG